MQREMDGGTGRMGTPVVSQEMFVHVAIACLMATEIGIEQSQSDL